MGKNTFKWLLFTACSLTLAACEPMPDNITHTKGKVVTMGKKHLILDDGRSVMFLAVEESDKARLNDLKKGDEVTLIGKKVPENEKSIDIEEIIKPDGSRVQLGV